jgi:hypothetical protein|nr:MAG TPA: hypothetical protein [Caudoviricetes sp.]
MKQKIKDLFRKAYNRLFRKESPGKNLKGLIQVDSDGTIHLYGDLLVHGNITGMGSVKKDTSFPQSDE